MRAEELGEELLDGGVSRWLGQPDGPLEVKALRCWADLDVDQELAHDVVSEVERRVDGDDVMFPVSGVARVVGEDEHARGCARCDHGELYLLTVARFEIPRSYPHTCPAG